jgi:hypothetical protein
MLPSSVLLPAAFRLYEEGRVVNGVDAVGVGASSGCRWRAALISLVGIGGATTASGREAIAGVDPRGAQRPSRHRTRATSRSSPHLTIRSGWIRSSRVGSATTSPRPRISIPRGHHGVSAYEIVDHDRSSAAASPPRETSSIAQLVGPAPGPRPSAQPAAVRAGSAGQAAAGRAGALRPFSRPGRRAGRGGTPSTRRG